MQYYCHSSTNISSIVKFHLQCAFTPEATCANKLRSSRVVRCLNILSLLASSAREIHLTTGANSRHGRGFCSSFRVGVSTMWDCLVEESHGNRLNSFCLLYRVLFMSFMFSSCKYSHTFVFSFDLHPLYIVNNHIFSTTLVNIAIFFHP